MTSYQRLKNKLAKSNDKIKRLLIDTEYWISESTAYKIKLEIDSRIMFGNSKQRGKIKFDGLIRKLHKS